MSSDFSRLFKQNFGDLEAAAKAWQKLSKTMGDLSDRHRTRVTGPLHEQWKGETADAALRYLEDVETRMSTVRTEAMAIYRTLDSVRIRMEQAQTNLRNAVRRAEADDYAVDDNGQVTDNQTNYTYHNDPDYQELVKQRSGPLGEYRQRIQDALDDAKKASDDGKRALMVLNGNIMDRRNYDAAAESASDVETAMNLMGIKEPQIPKKDPKAAVEWWKGLSPQEREEYAALYPDSIGATDGLPSAVRNDANRLALGQELNRLESIDDNYLASHPGASRSDALASYTPDEAQRMKNLLKLRDTLDDGDAAPKGKERYLLGFDSKGDGKAIIAMGNPDTADNTAVLVPGTNTTMDGVPGQLNRIGKLQDDALKWSGGESVAVISWLGYDAPEAAVDDFNSVITTGRAEDAAPDLRQFIEGTRAAQGSNHSHVTVIGHSYGSTVVGAAARGDEDLVADDIVVVGSPGMDVDDAGDLNMDPDHVWIGAAKDDPIINWGADKTLGPDPQDKQFGGHNFVVDTHGHSGYWGDNSESLDNQGRIIAGRRPSEAPKHTPSWEQWVK